MPLLQIVLKRTAKDFILSPCRAGRALLVVVAAALIVPGDARGEDAISLNFPLVIQGTPQALAVDAQGNRYVAGTFAGTVDFKLSTGTDEKTSAGDLDVFITRFNTDGSYGWTQTFGGTFEEVAFAIAVFDSTVYVTGSFDSSNAGVGGAGSLASSGSSDAFVLALQTGTGEPVSGFGTGGIQKFGGSQLDSGQGIAVSGATIFVGGSLASTDAGIGGTGTIASSGNYNAFVMALDASTGAAASGFGSGGVQTFGGPAFGNGIAISGSTVYLTGTFYGSSAGVGGSGTFATSGDSDAYVLALNAATGAAVGGFGTGGVQKFGGTDEDQGRGVAASGPAIYVVGSFKSTNAGIGGLGNLNPSGTPSVNNSDVFVLALDPATGAAVSGFGSGGAQKFGGSNLDSARDIVVSGGTVYVTAAFSGADAGIGGAGNFGASSMDAFVLALDGATGAGVSGFGAGGIQKFGGSLHDEGAGIAIFGSTVYVAGNFTSTDAGVGGNGGMTVEGFGGFLIPLDKENGKGNQVITFDPLADKQFTDENFDVVATADSGRPVELSLIAGRVILGGHTVAITGTGLVTIKASQAGNSNYNAAADVERLFIVSNSGTPFTLAKFSGAFKFTSADKDSCQLSGSFSLPSAPDFAGKKFDIKIAALKTQFTLFSLNGKGKGAIGTKPVISTVAFTSKLDKTFGTTLVAFTVKLKGTFASALLISPAADINQRVPMDIAVIFDGTTLVASANPLIKSKKGKGGTLKN